MITGIKNEILFYLDTHPTAKLKALLTHLENTTGRKVEPRKLRLIINDLIFDDGHNIRSSPTGWSLIRTPEHQAANEAYLKSYIFKLFKRLRASQRNYMRQTAKLIEA